MDLQIRNFGAIENADVKFDGLTVIAGENDTGKSTVGKLVFAVIKAISRYEENLKIRKEKNVKRLVTSLYLKLRGSDSFVDGEFISIGDTRSFRPENFLKDIRPYVKNEPSLYSDFSDEKGINEFFKTQENIIKNFNLPEKYKERKKEMLQILKDIKNELKREDEKSETLRKTFEYVLSSEFHSEFTPQDSQLTTTLCFNQVNRKLFDIEGKENEIKAFTIHDEILPFEGATFIESPLILQEHLKFLVAGLDNYSALISHSGSDIVPLHIKDLAIKLTLAINFTHRKNDSSLLMEIYKIVNGKWSIDEDKGGFVFTKNGKNTGQKFHASNVASGIKSFGIIQLLLLAEILNNRSLLIIDEPETHLHPKWQVEYAKIICLLVKHEIPVLLTSHSPYLIEALRYYSKEYGIERFTNYYLAERNDNGLVDIENVNENMNRVFHKLSEPFQKLLWEEA